MTPAYDPAQRSAWTARPGSAMSKTDLDQSLADSRTALTNRTALEQTKKKSPAVEAATHLASERTARDPPSESIVLLLFYLLLSPFSYLYPCTYNL